MKDKIKGNHKQKSGPSLPLYASSCAEMMKYGLEPYIFIAGFEIN